jgi:hypothetical protein
MMSTSHLFREVRNDAEKKKNDGMVRGYCFLGFGRCAFVANMELSKIASRSNWLLYRILRYVFGYFLRSGAFAY